MAESMNEEYLDRYLADYAKGSEMTDKRQKRCALCGERFDISAGVEMYIYKSSPIKIDGKRPTKICVCDECYIGAEKIESEGLFV